MKRARITEIYSSIQGEGPYAGQEHVFVRFFGCNLGCEFCDEKEKTDFFEYDADAVVDSILREKKNTVSLTGGEPLLQSDFLKEILPVLKKKNMQVYLETNGTMKNRLLDILDYVDTISMDLKLPSSTGLGAYWQEHLDFLKEAVKKEVFIKIVVTPETSLEDVKKAVSVVRGIDKDILFILQPVSYNGRVEKIDLLPSFFRNAKEELEKVTIIPQVHKILGVR